jgi:hypothetical protein
MTMLSGEDGLEPPRMFQIGGVPNLCRKRLACGCRVFCYSAKLACGTGGNSLFGDCVNLEMINGVVF